MNNNKYILLVQPNFQTGPKELNSYYIPYTVGSLWAYLSKNKKIISNLSPVIVFNREDIDTILFTAKTFKVAFFSVYVWNKHYCYSLAQSLKEAHPDITIVMGGPEVPKDEFGTYFIVNPYVDCIVEGEGELAAEECLLDIIEGRPTKAIYKSDRIKDLSILPSPYTDHHFDSLMSWNWERNQDDPNKHLIEWIPTIETDRGCPYGCTFCDWGSLTSSKMFQFPIERIFSDLKWAADNKMKYIALTSSNFGIYKDRDIEIAEEIVRLKSETGYPQGISVSYAKNSNDTVFDIVKMFTEAGIQTGLMVSLQTTTPKVLDIIKRKNMDTNNIAKIAAESKIRGLPLHTELILGLPGETCESWEETIEEVLSAGISNFDIFFLQILENAPMNLTQVSEYDMKSFKAYDYFYGTAEEVAEDPYLESIKVIKSTSTMNTDQLLESAMLSWFITGMHMYGSSNIIADYLHTRHNISYIDFYKELRSFLRINYPEFLNWENEVRCALENWHNDGMLNLSISGLDITGWEVFHSLAMLMHWAASHYVMCNVMTEFVTRKYGIDKQVMYDHREISIAQINKFNTIQTKSIEIKSDLLNTDYVTVTRRYGTVYNTLKEHCKYLVMARRRAWHLNVLQEIKNGEQTKK